MLGKGKYKGGDTMKKEETKLKKILREKGISQVFLAREIGMNIKTLNAIINGRINLSLETANKICRTLNINIIDLIE